MEKKYYIFDMDGTLIDSMPSYGGAVIKYLRQNNISYPDDTLKTVTPLGYAGGQQDTLSINWDVQQRLKKYAMISKI